MSTTTARPRPPQVTVAGWMLVIASVVLVLTGFEIMDSLHSLDTRRAIEQALSRPPADSLGLDVYDMIALRRWATLVAGGSAAALAILGWFVLRRHRGARVAATVLAVPLLLAGLFIGGFLPAVIATAVVTLWLQPARDWFNGRWRPDAAPRHGIASPGVQALPREHPAAAAPEQARGVPVPVLWACTLTWVFAGLGLVMGATTLLVVAIDPSAVLAEVHRQAPDLAAQGIGDTWLTRAFWIVGAVLVAWSLAGLVMAALAIARVRWAGTGLLVVCLSSAAVLLLGTLGSVVMLLPFGAASIAAGLLVRPEVRAWFLRRP
ncbi:MAG: hypothetical protein R2731_13540 [Nocardioides sp.]